MSRSKQVHHWCHQVQNQGANKKETMLNTFAASHLDGMLASSSSQLPKPGSDGSQVFEGDLMGRSELGAQLARKKRTGMGERKEEEDERIHIIPNEGLVVTGYGRRTPRECSRTNIQTKGASITWEEGLMPEFEERTQAGGG
uniref:Uncharacterized protein n=1 Tax=Oryza glumipatula TaxID=40148 RepID=A0A0E0AZM0_9ORYZ